MNQAAARAAKAGHKKLTVRSVIKRGLFITIGAVIMAYGLEAILIPNKMIDGGVTGLSMILSNITPINLSIFLVLLNLPFFFLGYKQIGKTFAVSMLYGIIALSVATSLFHHVEPDCTRFVTGCSFRWFNSGGRGWINESEKRGFGRDGNTSTFN